MRVETPWAFISSTIDDLQPERAVAQQAATTAGFHPVLSENFSASGHAPPLQACLQRVSDCDLLVVIVARRYGWVPKDASNSAGYSITWLECERARQEGKEVLAFLLREHAEWPPEFVDARTIVHDIESGTATPEQLLELQVRAQRLKDFKDYLNAQGIRSTFQSPEELHRHIQHALLEWRERHRQFSMPPHGVLYLPPKLDKRRAVARGIHAGAAVVAAAFGPKGGSSHWSTKTAGAFCANERPNS